MRGISKRLEARRAQLLVRASLRIVVIGGLWLQCGADGALRTIELQQSSVDDVHHRRLLQFARHVRRHRPLRITSASAAIPIRIRSSGDVAKLSRKVFFPPPLAKNGSPGTYATLRSTAAANMAVVSGE